MKIQLHGTRGSIPTSGTQFMRHGGSTTCLTIHTGIDDGITPEVIIIDGGSGLEAAGRQTFAKRAVWLQTHLHWDHLHGVPFFAPLYRPDTRLETYAVRREGSSLEDVLRQQLAAPTFPVSYEQLPATLVHHEIEKVGALQRGALRIEWTEVCHPSGCTAFRLSLGTRAFVFAGDVEVRAGCRDRLVEFATGADLLIMDAQYTEEEYATRVGWGHSTAYDAIDIAISAGVGELLLTHHDPQHDDDTLDQMLREARMMAPRTLQIDNARDGQRVELRQGSGLSSEPRIGLGA